MVPPGLKIGMDPPRYGPDKDTVQQRPSLYLLLQVYAWIEYQLMIFGIWSKTSFTPRQTNQRKPKIEREETRCVTPHQTSTPKTKPVE